MKVMLHTVYFKFYKLHIYIKIVPINGPGVPFNKLLLHLTHKYPHVDKSSPR